MKKLLVRFWTGVILAGWFGGIAVTAQVFDWTTMAGVAGTYGNIDGTNSDARFWQPTGVAVDGAGSVYVADSYNNKIRKVTRAGTNWVVSTLVGGHGGFDGTNGVIGLNMPNGVAVDDQGNIFVADTDSYTIRKLTPMGTNWVSSTIAGASGTGPGTADGTNNAARFYMPWALALGKDGSLYVADNFNHTIRKITPVGTNWVTTTIGGLGRSAGHADGTNSVARFYYPWGVGVDLQGNVYVADSSNDTIRKIRSEGTNWVTTTIAGMALTSGSADGTNSDSRFFGPRGLAVDAAGNIYIGDVGNSTIRKLTAAGTNWVSSTIGGLTNHPGGGDGVGSAARFGSVHGIAIDRFGVFYLGDTSNNNLRQGVGLPVLEVGAPTNGTFTLSWGAVPGQMFQVQQTADLVRAPWINWNGPVLATNGTVWASDAIDPDALRFYRVMLLQQQ